jgi:hypothetical protein
MSGQREYRVRELSEHDDIVYYNINTKIKLKKHQFASISACVKLENECIFIENPESPVKKIYTKIGILGDKVGSGKTYTILGLFLANETPLIRIDNKKEHGLGHILFDNHEAVFLENLEMNVIVCSFGLLNQWKTCIGSFSDLFNLHVVSSKASLDIFTKSYVNYNITLVSASFYKPFQEFINTKLIHVKRCVFDEVDSVSVPSSKEIPAYFNWLVSATYKNVLYPFPRWVYADSITPRLLYTGINNNNFVKNIFTSILRFSLEKDIDLIDRIVVKCKDSFVDESFRLIEPIKNVIICTNLHVSILEGITNDHIIRCLNAGDVSSAISHIDKNRVGNEYDIIQIVKESLTIQYTNTAIILNSTQNLIFSSESLRDKKIKSITNELDHINSKLKMLEERIINSDLCLICFCEFESKSITSCCKNAFCFRCICIWMTKKNNCPCCKEFLSPNELYVIDQTKSKTETTEVQLKKMDKFKTLFKLIEEIRTNKKSKIVIFSEYDQTFANIEECLSSIGIKFGFMKGNGINNVINNYKKGDIDILLVNSKSYGSGINLENTTDIILFHRFDSQIENQVIGRAQRPGRTSRLNIHYLLHENEKNKGLN